MRKTVTIFAAALTFWTFGASAQQTDKVWQIGFLTAGKPAAFTRWIDSFANGLEQLGYVRDKNFVIKARFGQGRRSRLPLLATELINGQVDLIVTHGSPASQAAKNAAKRAGKATPIVFAVEANPLGNGTVASLSRPGGNITGLTDYHANLVPKRLELLKIVLPSMSRLAVLHDPLRAEHRLQWKVLEKAATPMGVKLLQAKLSKPEDIESLFAFLRNERPDALIHFGYPLFGAFHKRIAAFTVEDRLPAIATLERTAVAGFLMSYGVDFPDMYRRAATMVDKILKGRKPADLPVEQPTRFYLTINLKTAKTLGVKIAPSILLRADKVIE